MRSLGLALAALLVTLPVRAQPSGAAPVLGAPVRLVLVGEQGARYGRLVRVTPDTVFLEAARVSPALAWADLRRLDAQVGTRASRPAQIVLGTALGAAGLLTGTAAGALSAWGAQSGGEGRVLVGALGGAALGALAGVALGSAFRTPVWAPVEPPR